MSTHRSGFINIIGKPNAGKSSLMNALLGEKMCIISSKPQTTRHRIFGIMNDEGYQAVFSDTPGYITSTSYKMQEAMNKQVLTIFEDADVILMVHDVAGTESIDKRVMKRLAKMEVPIFLVLNKIDLVDKTRLEEIEVEWKEKFDWTKIFRTSALEKTGVESLKQEIIDALPEGPAYYPKDQLSDRPQRFFVSEIIRENILDLYHQEIPYASEVIVTEYKEKEKNGKAIVHIYAQIFVMRKSQKMIMLGKGGSAIKQLGIESRKDIESYLGCQVFLELYVKIREKWRDDDRTLKSFGYLQ